MGVHTGHRWVAISTVILAGTIGMPSAFASASVASDSPVPSVSVAPGVGLDSGDGELSQLGWIWPAESFTLIRPFIQPAHEYGPGHRGVDLDLSGGTAVRSPADGIIAFVGVVAGRPIVTIAHDGELVSTLEPVVSELSVGAAVRRGETLGVLGVGGHVSPGALHFGVRREGAYINPLLLLGGIPRAVLLPCCE